MKRVAMFFGCVTLWAQTPDPGITIDLDPGIYEYEERIEQLYRSPCETPERYRIEWYEHLRDDLWKPMRFTIKDLPEALDKARELRDNDQAMEVTLWRIQEILEGCEDEN